MRPLRVVTIFGTRPEAIKPDPLFMEMKRRRDRIALLRPLDYIPFVDLMGRSHLMLMDSGGGAGGPSRSGARR